MANEIKIAEGTVGVTNYINTEVADNEYPVMGSGIKAAMASMFDPYIIHTVYADDDDDDNMSFDKTDEEIYAEIQAGRKFFALFDYDVLIMICAPDVRDDGSAGLSLHGNAFVSINDDNTATIGYLYASWYRSAEGEYTKALEWREATVATQ